MNICIFGDSFLPKRGGMEYVIHHLAQSLVGQGHSVTVIAKKGTWSAVTEPHNYRLYRYSIPIPGFGRLGVHSGCAILTFITQHLRTPFDVIHCHSSSFAGTHARRIKYIFKKLPLVITPHGEDIQRVPELQYGLRLNKAWDTRIRKNLRSADLVTAISMSVENELRVLNISNVERVPNGVQTNRFNVNKSQYLRERLSLDEDTLIYLSVGRNHIVKGYSYGIEAMAQLVKKHGAKNIHYVIVGRGVSVHSELVRTLQMNNNISLIEEMPPDAIQQCYSSADVFFSPSIIEGLSLVSIEAISSGLPLVVTDVPGNIDIVEETHAGFIAKSKDVESMAMQLIKFLDADLRNEYAQRAISSAGIYDWSVIAARYVRVYELAAENARTASR